MRRNDCGKVRWLSLVVVGIFGCGPSEEFKKHQKEACLNRLCEGDVPPASDRTKEYVFKRGGKWFVGPKEYGAYNGSFAFFWPSKTPANKSSALKEAPEFIPLGPDRVSNFFHVGIEFFIEGQPQNEEMYELIETAEKNGEIQSREQLRPELEKVQRKQVDAHPKHVLYVASLQKTPKGVPAAVSCDEGHKLNACTTGFYWKPGLRIYVRFSQAHGKDWPEIYSEIIRILSMVKEG